jgi:hypothetical protein
VWTHRASDEQFAFSKYQLNQLLLTKTNGLNPTLDNRWQTLTFNRK